jgi:hypothetical protein
MSNSQTLAFSRRECARVVHDLPSRKQRAQETPGAQPHPQPRVQNKKVHEQFTTGLAGASGASCAMVLTVYSVLSPVIGLF